MSFLAELKRRNVFRVGIAYGITAWLLVQVADILLDTFDAPDWTMKFIVVSLLIGFPLALIFAWAFELTPDGIRREAEVDRSRSITTQTGRKLDRAIIVVLAVALAGFAWDKFAQPEMAEMGSEPFSQATGEQTAIPDNEKRTLTPAAEKSIAVLPFTDMSAEGDQAYFGDGIAEEILNVLVKTHKLKVAGRTSSFQFRDRNEDLRQIGEQLGVDHILEGSIRKASNRIRITAQLIKADDGFHLWSETYDRQIDDIFAVQDEIARAITDALAIQLDIEHASQPLAPAQTGNMTAYERYLEARTLVAQRLDFHRAITLLEEATRLDANFSEAWAMLAQAHALAPYYGAESFSVAVAAAENHARHAIELDPQSSVAFSALGDAMRDQKRWNEAWDDYQNALRINPDNVEAHSQLGQMLMRLGHLEEALVHAGRAAEIDPLSWVNQGIYGLNLYFVGQRQAGWEALDKSFAISGRPRSVTTRIMIRAALDDGNKDRARVLAEQYDAQPDTTDPGDILYFQKVVPLLDRPDEARAYLHSVDFRAQNDLLSGLYWPVYFGDLELAQQWLRSLLSVDSGNSLVDPIWLQFVSLAPLMDMEEFRQLMQMNRFDEFWREHGWPAYCWPTSPVDFACGSEKPR